MRSSAELTEQAARDLRWLVDCPSLLDCPATPELPDPFAAGAEPDWSPVLRFHETKAAFRVGYYVESLIRVWLEATPGITDLRHGTQVIRDRETLGELDFLYRLDGVLHHLEVAMKYYLYLPDQSVHGSHYIGPNAADTFERKRDRLLGKQIPFGKKSFPEIEQSHVLVKGMIFYRPGDPPPRDLPEGLNPGHARGIWSRESEREKGLGPCRGAILPKPFWLDVPDEVKEAGAESGHLERELARLERRHPGRPRLLCHSRDDSETAGGKLFLVPDHWPARK